MVITSLLTTFPVNVKAASTTITSAAALANVTALLEQKVLFTNMAADAKKKMNDLENMRTLKRSEIQIIQLAYDFFSEEDKLKADVQLKTAQSHLDKVSAIADELKWKIKASDLAMSKIDVKIASVISEVNPSVNRFVVTGIDGILVVKDNFTIFGIGNNDYGNLGCGNVFTPMKTPCQTVDTGVLKGKVIWKMKAGIHTVMLTTDNTLISFGYGDQGALGDGKSVTSNVPVLVATGTLLNGKQVRDLETGQTGTIVATTDGQMFGWGNNIWGELCLPPGVYSKPTLLPTFTKKFKKVFYQIITSVFVTEDNEFYGCGWFPGSYTYSNYQKLDMSTINQTVDSVEEVSMVSGGWYYRTKSGSVYEASTNGKPVLVPYFANEGIKVVKICTGPRHLLALSSNGTVYQRGGLGYIRYVDQLQTLGIGDQPTNPFKIVGNDIEKHKIVDIVCNSATNLAISDTGEVFGWGRSILFGNGGTSTLVPTKLTLP